jgi:hypothetical protein
MGKLRKVMKRKGGFFQRQKPKSLPGEVKVVKKKHKKHK